MALSVVWAALLVAIMKRYLQGIGPRTPYRMIVICMCWFESQGLFPHGPRQELDMVVKSHANEGDGIE